jgi:hypothetical protein
MPALVALGPLILALVALALAIAADLMIRAIGNAIGKVGIGPVTWDVGSFFVGKAEAVLSWAIKNLDQYFSDAGNWFVGHIEVLQQFAGGVVQAIGHIGDQIAHIVTSVVPNAISAAESSAGAHAQALVNGVEDDLKADFNSLTDTLKGDVKTINSTISGDVTSLKNLLTKSVAAGVSAAEGYTDTIHNTINGYIDKSVSDAEGIAAGATAALAKTIGSQLSNLTDTVAKNLTDAETYAKAQATNVYQEVEGDLTSTAKTLQTGINAAQNEAISAITVAGQDLTTAEQVAATDAGNAVSSAESFATQAAGAAATTAEQALSGALGGIYTDLTGQALAVNGDLSTVEGLIAGAILTSVGAVAARVAKLEECSVGVCDDSPNNFGSLLNAALGLAEFAGVGVFLAKLISDPAGAEAQYSDLIGGLFSSGQSAFDALLSL